MALGPIERLHMIILMQSNVQAAIDFYSKLGIKLIFHIKDTWAEMKLGDIKIGLCPTQQIMDGHRTGIVLQVADLKKVYEEYKDTIHFFGEPKEATHGLMVSFKDPSGNILDLYQPTPEKVIQLVKGVAGNKQTEEQDKADCARKEGCCKTKQVDIACG